MSGPDGTTTLTVSVGEPSAWIISSDSVDRAGQPVTTLPTWVDDCMGPPSRQTVVGETQKACFTQLADAGYRQRITYQPGSRFWLFQGLETEVFLLVTAALCGFGFFWIRRRLS